MYNIFCLLIFPAKFFRVHITYNYHTKETEYYTEDTICLKKSKL